MISTYAATCRSSIYGFHCWWQILAPATEEGLEVQTSPISKNFQLQRRHKHTPKLYHYESRSFQGHQDDRCGCHILVMSRDLWCEVSSNIICGFIGRTSTFLSASYIRSCIHVIRIGDLVTARWKVGCHRKLTNSKAWKFSWWRGWWQNEAQFMATMATNNAYNLS